MRRGRCQWDSTPSTAQLAKRRLPVRGRTERLKASGSSEAGLQRLVLEVLMATAEGMESAPNQAAKIWVGIALGAAVGIGIALSRRKKTRWESAREITHRVADHSSDLAEVTRGIVDRVRNIYEESRRVVEDASGLWSQGRRLVGR